MHLWTDYEGKTIAGYLLGRLNRSEGRNAFFTTTTPDGQRALIRLTEAHFDETELMDRWKRTAGVSHKNLQAIRRVGQYTFEGLSLACCLLEFTDATLSDVLRERVLTVEETKQVAEAVSGALAVLHAAGMVHEHVDATNVFAAGEVIKLRSDCCRVCAGDFEADTPEAREALRLGDVHDLGVLMLRCLGLQESGFTAMKLAKPFDRIIPAALNGTTTAEAIFAVLQPPKEVPKAAVVQTDRAVATTPPVQVKMSAVSVEAPVAKRADAGVSSFTRKTKEEAPLHVSLDGLRNQSRLLAGTTSAGMNFLRQLKPMLPRSISPKAYMGWGGAAAVVSVVLWGLLSGSKPQTVAMVPERKPVISQAAPAPTEVHDKGSLLATGERAGWHVIAYTYRYEQQAEAQVKRLQSKYMNLHPQVFTPTGHAPYFVALGSSSDAATAMDIRNRARQAGLPRDTYARNF